MSSRRTTVFIGLIACAFVLASAGGALGGQDKPKPDPKALEAVAGKYTGTANTPQGEMAITAELKVEGTAITGTIGTAEFMLPITAGSLEGTTLTLTLDMNGNLLTLSGPFKDGRFEGAGSMGGGVVITKAGTAAAPATAKPAGAAPVAGADPISGDWDGLVDAPDQQRAFTLKLKLDGEKVTGEVSAEMGTTTLQTGSFAGGTFSVSFPFTTGDTITMTATLQEGKLVGQMSLGTQMTMPWVAVKKK